MSDSGGIQEEVLLWETCFDFKRYTERKEAVSQGVAKLMEQINFIFFKRLMNYLIIKKNINQFLKEKSIWYGKASQRIFEFIKQYYFK